MLSLIFSREIILFLSNDQFLPGSTALQVLGLTLPFLYLDILFGEILVAVNARVLLIRIAIVMLVSNLALNLIFIPLYSYHAAAVITLSSEIMLSLINWYYVRRFVPYRFDLLATGKIILITALSGVIGWKLGALVGVEQGGGLRLISLILTTLVFYALGSFAIGILKPSQLKFLIKSES